MTTYTTTLQTELQQVGYYEGAVDGIYGPLTVDGVKRLQADNDLPETGFVDRATARRSTSVGGARAAGRGGTRRTPRRCRPCSP